MRDFVDFVVGGFLQKHLACLQVTDYLFAELYWYCSLREAGKASSRVRFRLSFFPQVFMHHGTCAAYGRIVLEMVAQGVVVRGQAIDRLVAADRIVMQREMGKLVKGILEIPEYG
jgi:hypothetical protein